MNKIKIVVLGCLTSGLMVTGANAQGLIGQPYFGVDGGWERLENGDSDNGWGVGAELNAPIPMDPEARMGAELGFRGDYMDLFDRDIWRVEGLLRGYMTAHEGLTPYVGAGFGWVDFDDVDSTFLPLEAGVEFALGPGFALQPFFRYSFAFDSAVDDFWSVGARGVYWLPAAGWGITASVTYTDYDDVDNFDIDSGIGARVGLVFSY